jgi:hypothetical protein
MILWLLCAFIWFKNIEKMLLQMTSGFLQLESILRVDSASERCQCFTSKSLVLMMLSRNFFVLMLYC